MWDPEQLRRHVAVLESELSRIVLSTKQAQMELESLRRWKAEVESSRSWKLANRIARLRRPWANYARADMHR